MSNAELDAAVLAVLGFERSHNICGNLVMVCRGELFRVGYDSLSTSDAEALRLCGPWLDERCEWHLSFHREEECGQRKHVAAAYDKDLYFFKVRCATRAEAIARLVLAVAEREAERKEPTT